MENKPKNYGIDWKRELAERDGTEYKHLKGISPISIFAIPPELREKYLPAGERQNIGEEKMDCVSRAVCNWYENELNYAYANSLLVKDNEKWLQDNGYIDENGKIVLSDVFIALGSGTTRDGNSLKAPIDFARKNGMIPKKLLPQLEGFDENYNPARVTQQIKDLGTEFLKRLVMNYEQVSELQFSQNEDGLVCALHAWLPPVEGIYQRNDLDPNHSVYRFNKPKNHLILDNYEEVQNDFIKELASDFNFMDYAYRLYFFSQKDTPKIELTAEKKNLFSGLVWILRDFWQKIKEAFGDRTFGVARTSQWKITRKLYLEKYPNCAVCGKKGGLLSPLNVHHKKLFNRFPALELEESNLIVLCRDDHFLFGHLYGWKYQNDTVEEDAKIWNDKLKNRS